MYMPLMVDIQKALVFGGERGEGLQKVQKLSVFADSLLVVPEGDFAGVVQPEQPDKEGQELGAAGQGSGLSGGNSKAQQSGRGDRSGFTPVPGFLVLPPGPLSLVREKLSLEAERRIPVHPRRAAELAGDELAALIDEADFVCSDLADRTLNETISRLCREKGRLCNIIDTKDLCSVWFMSLVSTPSVLAGVSSRGQAASVSANLRAELQPWMEAREGAASILTRLRTELGGREVMKALGLVWKDWGFRLKARWGRTDKALAHARRLLKRRGYL